MSRTPFQLRMDDDRLERLRRVAAKMQMSKAEIIETAIDARLDLLEGYVKLDTAPPKTAAGVKRQVEKLKGVAFSVPSEVVSADTPLRPRTGHKPVTLNGGVKRVRGWDAEGRPVY